MKVSKWQPQPEIVADMRLEEFLKHGSGISTILIRIGFDCDSHWYESKLVTTKVGSCETVFGAPGVVQCPDPVALPCRRRQKGQRGAKRAEEASVSSGYESK